MLSEALPFYSSLVKLNLWSDEKEPKKNAIIDRKITFIVNDIKDFGARMLSESLKTNTTLIELSLFSNEKENKNEKVFDN